MVRAMATPRLALAAFVVACSSPAVHAPAPPNAHAASSDPAFAALSQRFLDGYFRLSPVDATQAGEHAYDGTWPDLSAQGDDAMRAFLADVRKQLAAFPAAKLSQQDRIDAQILEDQIASKLFSLDELKPADHDPILYTTLIGEGLDPLVNRNFGTPESRAAGLRGRLDGIPALVAVAKQRLAHPAQISTQTAIKQNAGLIGLVEGELAPRFADKPELAASAKRAATALHELQISSTSTRSPPARAS
jgi:hypothetical protein